MYVVVMFVCRHDSNDPLSTQDVVKLESPKKYVPPIKTSGATNGNLPSDAIAKWRKVFVPTFGAYIGTKHDPWDIRDTETINAMRDCWKHVYQSTSAAEYHISGTSDPVFVVVSTLALVKYSLIGHIGQSAAEGNAKHRCQSCPPGPR